MDEPAAVTSANFFDSFARYKLLELLYDVALPAPRAAAATAATADVQARQQAHSDEVYLDPSSEAAWDAVADVIALQRERIADLEDRIAELEHDLAAARREGRRNWSAFRRR